MAVGSPARMRRARRIQSVRPPLINWAITSCGLHVLAPSLDRIQPSGSPWSSVRNVAGVRSRTSRPCARSKFMRRVPLRFVVGGAATLHSCRRLALML
jgi:hypothetical protein